MQTDLLLQAFKDRLSELGYELYDLRIGGAKNRPVVDVRIDVPRGEGDHSVTDRDCVRASRGLEVWLDEEQPFGSRYILQVSSPGIERPLRRAEQWRRFVGEEANVRLRGRGRFRARIVDVPDEEHVVVDSASHGTERLDLEAIREASLAFDW